MKTVLIIDSVKNRDISFLIGLERSEYLRVAVHSSKAARTALSTVQFDIVVLGSSFDGEDPSTLLKEFGEFVPRVIKIQELMNSADSSAAVESE